MASGPRAAPNRPIGKRAAAAARLTGTTGWRDPAQNGRQRTPRHGEGIDHGCADLGRHTNGDKQCQREKSRDDQITIGLARIVKAKKIL